jgi:hypothetical protein
LKPDKIKSKGHHCGNKEDWPGISKEVQEKVNDSLGQPAVINPGLAEFGMGKWIGRGNGLVFDNPTARLQMPPDIRIRHNPNSHRKDRNKDNCAQ